MKNRAGGGLWFLFGVGLVLSTWLVSVSAEWGGLKNKPRFHGYESTIGDTSSSVAGKSFNQSSSSRVQSSPAKQARRTEPETSRPLSLQASDIYYLGPSDVLDIEFFNVEELNQVVRINERGYIKLPLVGALHVGGLTSDQLEATLTELYGKDYLQNPQVSVFIKDYAGQYTMEGLVRRVGVFPLRGQTTVLQAIAQAGGLSDVADDNDITLFRRSREGQMKEHIFDYEKIKEGKAEDFLLEPNDVVIVNLSLAKAFGRRLLGAISLGTLSPAGYVGR